MTEQEAWVVLNALPGVGNGRVRSLVERFGSACAVMEAGRQELEQAECLSAHALENLLYFSKDKFLQSEYNFIQKNRVSVICYGDEAYPEQLRDIPDAPAVLYVRGRLKPAWPLTVALVGSRRATLYGLATAETFAAGLAEWGFAIVSGMARGIDTAAHRGCLKANGSTTAVLGCGLNHVYPPENAALADTIAETGAVVSEFPMDTPPAAYNFPRRNRIISGLGFAVVVVEATLKSGALITCDVALDQGREVYAVPGPVDSPQAQGTNRLIREGAALVTNVDDIVQELAPRLARFLPRPAGDRTGAKDGLEDGAFAGRELEFYRYLSEGPVHVDALAERGGTSPSETAAVLLQLQMKKAVQRLPGNMFVRVEKGTHSCQSL